ncbi:MAG: putative bifunctional diguanylate cyclase/phosphodiesterase [Actinomycetota bacterium]
MAVARTAIEGTRRRLLPAFDGAQKVTLLTAAIGIAAVSLFLALVRPLVAVQAPVRLHWLILAVLFFAAEAFVVHIEFRRNAHSISLSEVVLVIGLCFADPASLLLGHVIGGAAALALISRQSLQKVAFNVGHFSLATCVAIVVYHAIGGAHPLDPSGLAAAFAATTISSLIGIVLIFVAISLSEGSLRLGILPQMLGSGIVVTTANTALGLITVQMLWGHPAGVWLVLIPVAIVFIAYREFTGMRQKYDGLEFLHETSRVVHSAADFESALLDLLSRVRTMLRAEVAEITLFREGTSVALRTRIGPDTKSLIMDPTDIAALSGWISLVRGDRPALIKRSDEHSPIVDQSLSVRDAMVVPITEDGSLIGMMLVANRLGDVSTFDPADMKLLETLANQAGVWLEKGRLEKTLAHVNQLKDQLKKLAFHDVLTGLANRALMFERLEHALVGRNGPGRGVAVLFLDLDDFKTINDSLGHSSGDQLLCEVADRLKTCVRPEDTVARLGGDEFAIVMEHVTSSSQAHEVAQRMIDAFDTPFKLAESEVFVHGSIGIARGIPGVHEAEEVMRNADMAMYRAKNSGESNYEEFEATMHRSAVQRMDLLSQLRSGVVRNEFSLRYQPIVSLGNGAIKGFEALVRWDHPQRGEIGPCEFIPLAEETGLIVVMGRWILHEACKQASEWLIHLPRDISPYISVNLSARQLADPAIVEDVSAALAESGLDPQCLMLEITESMLMHDIPATEAKLRDLKNLGVRLAIDDFGTGYSSLSHLSRFPLDAIKIPKPFVDSLGNKAREDTLARTIITMGESLGLETIAEGIELVNQVDDLRSLRCLLGQGFYFAKPLSGLDMETLLRFGNAYVNGMDLDEAPVQVREGLIA